MNMLSARYEVWRDGAWHAGCSILSSVNIGERRVERKNGVGVTSKEEGTVYVSYDEMGEGDSNIIIIGAF